MQSVLNLNSAPLNNRRIKEQKRERCTLQESYPIRSKYLFTQLETT